jgi:uncharacterized membrane protein
MTVDLQGLLHALGERERAVLAHVLRRTPTVRDSNAAFDARLTFGERLADRVASFGGSWTFIILFLGAMSVWMLMNVESAAPFDPYPFILLNLVLSCLAALQAPIIMMSQNRQAAKDRLDAQHDYEVNLKAEMEIMALHLKLDELREQQWTTLMAVQAEQMKLLERLSGGRAPSAG